MESYFENPVVIWALLALIPFLIWDSFRHWASGRRRQWFSVALRVVMLALIIFALASPQRQTSHEIGDVIFVVDRSASIPDVLLTEALSQIEQVRSNLGSDERVGLVFFDRHPEVIVYPGEEWLLPPVTRPLLVDQTDVSLALEVALGLIPSNHRGTIVLVTDGRPTRGNLRGALGMAQARDVSIWTMPIDPGHADPAVDSIELESSSVRPGETIAGTVQLRGGPDDMSGHLTLTIEGETVLDEMVSIEANGTLEVAFEHSLEQEVEPGLLAIEAVLEPIPETRDEQTANNRLSVGVNVTEPPTILVIAHDTEETENLRDSLEAEMMAVEVISAVEMEENEDLDFDDYDLIFLSNVPAMPTEDGEAHLGEERSEALRRYVSAGGGLIVLGGDRTYELGGYGQTALTTVLPIELQPRDPEIQPAVTMMVILDNSGSMTSWAEGGTKMDLANAGAVAAMNLLRDFDQIGVMAVDDRVHWAVPLQQVSDRDALERGIRGITAGGGGIYVYTGLREAYRTIRTADTPLRHVILFSDAADSEEQVAGVVFGWGPGPNCYDLARSMRSEGITVSVIGIGYDYDSDTAFLRTLAEAGGGRFYLTSRAAELQTFFVEETQRVVDSVLDESPFRVRSVGEHPAVEGLDFRQSPRFDGYIELIARPTAHVELTHPDDHPVMTTWQYGLGQVAAMAIDAGPRWAENWLDWEGYSVFWTQLARWAMRRHEGDETAIEVAFDESVAHLRVARHSSEGLTEIEGGVRAVMFDTTTTDESPENGIPVPLDVVEPGLWESLLETEPGHRYRVQIVDATGEVFAEQTFVAPASPEFRYEGVDTLSLTEIAERTGGAYNPTPDEVRPQLATLHEYEPLWMYLLCCALILLPFDAFLRRPARDA